MGWYSPLERAILPLDGLRISRSLRKSIRHYEVRIDTAFDDVLDGCADRRRPSGWINREIAGCTGGSTNAVSCTRWKRGPSAATWPAVSMA
jgi:leucyl/phenylalanyl-tRNA--protein transferase